MLFLPISLFKNYKIQTGSWESELKFGSSGTTNAQNRAYHYFRSSAWYKKVSSAIFMSHYTFPNRIPILALLPNYLERSDSSLVFMVDHFIQEFGTTESGFFLNNMEDLLSTIKRLNEGQQKGILIGVSFALLDLAEKHNVDLNGWIVMETGGMKGRREEMTRLALHTTLKENFNVESIHSEYGMTELCSQSYANKDGIFEENAFFKVDILKIDDPFEKQPLGKLGRIAITDLGNLHSCSFIATDDLGRKLSNTTFTVEGRIDNSDMRGCNLLYQ